MAKTYDQIQSQILKLQQEADALKAKEVAGVVARIQGAIAHYGLTPADLFGKTSAAAGKRAPKAAAPARAARPAKVDKATKSAKPPAAAKYQDGGGNHWSGVGKRPNWFKAALATGKTADDLLLKPPAA